MIIFSGESFWEGFRVRLKWSLLHSIIGTRQTWIVTEEGKVRGTKQDTCFIKYKTVD